MNASIIQLEKNLFGDDRMIEVAYRLPTMDFDDIEIVSVNLSREVYWNEAGLPIPHHVSVDILPVLYAWQVSEIMDDIKAELGREADCE